MHRGQRLADQPFAARYPGLLTHGIDDPETYIYRDILADCLRGAEFLLGRPEIDDTRVAVVGDDVALLTAALRPGFATVQAGGLMFYRMWEGLPGASAYPLEEVNDLLRAQPEVAADVERTLSYFDPLHHADVITAMVTLGVDDPGTAGGAERLRSLIERLGERVTLYQLTHEGGTDHDRLDAMLAERMGVAPMSRFRREL
jgi:cephalosporin-C deacetylase-like acetyl esterase